MADDVIDDILNAKATFNSANIVDGAGRLMVKQVYPSKKTNKGRMCIVEFEVLSSKNLGPYFSPERGANIDVEPNQPGTTCSAKFPLDNPDVKSGPGNAKALLLALFGLTEDETDPKSSKFDAVKTKLFADSVRELHAKSDAAAGMVVDYQTTRILTRGDASKGKKPHDITLPNFKIAEGENTREKVLARRKAADAPKP